MLISILVLEYISVIDLSKYLTVNSSILSTYFYDISSIYLFTHLQVKFLVPNEISYLRLILKYLKYCLLEGYADC